MHSIYTAFSKIVFDGITQLNLVNTTANPLCDRRSESVVSGSAMC